MSEQWRLWEERRKERPETTGIPTPVCLEATSVRFTLPFENRPRLSYQVRLAKESVIELSSGLTIVGKKPSGDEREKCWPLDGYFNVFAEKDEPNEAKQESIGTILYFPDFESDNRYADRYFVEVVVPRATFDELLAAARLGRYPSDLMIDVEGMDLKALGDWIAWDNKSFPELDVISAKFTFSERATLSDEAPPTGSQVKELSEKLDHLYNLGIDMHSGLRSLLWAVLVIGVLTLILRVFR